MTLRFQIQKKRYNYYEFNECVVRTSKQLFDTTMIMVMIVDSKIRNLQPAIEREIKI